MIGLQYTIYNVQCTLYSVHLLYVFTRYSMNYEPMIGHIPFIINI